MSLSLSHQGHVPTNLYVFAFSPEVSLRAVDRRERVEAAEGFRALWSAAE